MDPNEELSITLTVAEWNQILGVLGKRPYEEVATIIAKMRNQGEAAANAPAEAAPRSGPQLVS